MEPVGYNDSNWSYQYEVQEYGYKKLVGAYYLGEYYTYVYNESDVIEGMLDSNGNQIVKYTYDQYGLLSEVFSNENGVWIENNSSDFIGNKNRMLLSGMYFDENTNCYYINQRYYNPVLNRYMDGINNEDISLDANPFLDEDVDYMPYGYADSELAAELWRQQLLASSSYGVPIPTYSSSWYSSLSDVEIVARAIYCEGGTAYTDEDSAVAWVILNRINSTGFPNSAAAVVKASGQFASITGGSGATRDARIPSTNTARWRHSTFLACLLLTTTSESEWDIIIGNKINGQLYFYSYTTAQNNSVFTGMSSSTLKYNGTDINNVYVLGYGYVSSFPTLFNNYNPIEYSRNIYYDIK
jgi:YD repeat-containing protein